jgi:hypothetical protein
MHFSYGLNKLRINAVHHVVICRKDYTAPFDVKVMCVFRKGEVYQAEDHGAEIGVWRSKRSFLKFSPIRFRKYFSVFC